MRVGGGIGGAPVESLETMTLAELEVREQELAARLAEVQEQLAAVRAQYQWKLDEFSRKRDATQDRR